MTRPLRGRRIVVTRPERQAAGLVERLSVLGADVASVPLIRIVAIDDDPRIDAALDRLAEYAMVIVTSANAADCLVDTLRRRGLELPPAVSVVAIGGATTARLGEYRIRADIVPLRATGADILASLADHPIAGTRVLLPRAREGRPELPRGLRAAGALVDDIAFYDTAPVVPGEDGVAAIIEADAVVVTSPSAVNALVSAIRGHAARSIRVVTIGPTTSDAATRHGLVVSAEAADQSVDGLAEALVRALGEEPGQPPS